MPDQNNPQQTQALDMKVWLARINRSRAFWYDLDEGSKPKHLKLGRRIVILEAPEAWLERMHAAGGVVTKQRAAA